MAEIIAQAARVNYRNSTLSSGNAQAFYNDTYKGQIASGNNNGIGIFDGYSFSGLTNDSRIVAIKFQGRFRCLSRDALSYTSYCSFKLVTDYYNGSTTSSSNNYYTSISPDDRIFIQEQKKYDDNQWDGVYTLDANTDEVAWANNHLSLVNSGNKFGLRFYGRQIEFQKLRLVLVLDDGSKIYPGGTQATAVYVGGTKAKAVYLGSTKIL